MDAMSPSDAEVALRSLARRFRAAVTSAASEDEAEDALAHRAGPDGRSVVDHLSAAIAGLSLLDRAFEQIVTGDVPVLPAGVIDPDERDFTVQVSGPPMGLEETLLDLDLTAGQFADRVDDTPARDWTRRATIAGSTRSVQAIDLVRRAVTESIDHLKCVEQTLKAVRGT